jgi:hypothetical protein
MKNLIGVTLALLMSVSVATAQDVKLDGFKVLESKILEASMHGDSAKLDILLADDYVSIGASGHIRSRAEIIKAYTSGSLKVPSAHSEPKTIRQYGSIAIVVGLLTMAGTDNGKDISGRYAFTRVYKNDSGKWRAVSFEATPIK